MEEINLIIKRSFMTSFIILIYGILIREKVVFIGMFLGSLVSILAFYMIYLDIKNNLKVKSSKYIFLGYLKRYLIYATVLAIASYFGKLPMMLATAVGLINIKFNIILFVLNKKLSKMIKKK